MSEIINTEFTKSADSAEAKDIIIIRQLPVMEERFQEISEEIKRRLSVADNLEVSEDTKSEVKKILADFKKEFDIFEARRKEVKAEINKPYDEINELYKTYVEQPYKHAFDKLSAQIRDIERLQKNRALNEAEKYYAEYRASLGLSFPNFDAGRFTINLSTTLKNLREQIKKFLDGVRRDVESINAMGEQADDIMLEYKKFLCLSSAIKIVGDRIKAKQQYEYEKSQYNKISEQQTKSAEKVDEVLNNQEQEALITPAQEITPPTDEEKSEDVKRFVFWADVTREKFDKLIKFMKDEGIKYGKHTGA